ncbi:hypothetical protein EG830_07530 [bacterium]|nr:hypothetical protein [bacterium]
MKIAALLLSCIAASGWYSVTWSQNNCKVLKQGIDSIYAGECKQGLANGQGVASGIDWYNGEFKKGLPEGIGTYIWKNGDKYEGEWKKGLRDGTGKYTVVRNGRDSVVAGIWESDKYIGEERIAPYVIQYRNGVSRVSCVRSGDQPQRIYYKFTRGGSTSENTSPISDLLLQGSSGNESSSSNYFGFDDVTFPFEGKVKFTAPSALSSPGSPTAVMLNYELNFVINQPGAWMVTIYY